MWEPRRSYNRLFVEAVLYRYRAGIPWRDLPLRFGDFRVIHTRFSRWSKTGVWEHVFQHLADDADNEYAMIDVSVCPCPSTLQGCKGGDASTEAIGRSKGGLSTKIHAVVDALGNPLSFHLTPGQACDLDGADQLLPNIVADTVLADKGYDADERVIERLIRHRLRRQKYEGSYAEGIPINKFRGFTKDAVFKSATHLEIHIFFIFHN